MRIIVSDTSCIIDLRKAALLLEALRLPYTFVTVNTLFEDEWLSLSDSEKKQLCEQGLEVRELPGSSVQRAAQYFNQHRRLKLNDCFALTLAEDTKDSILLTGDGQLRRIAQKKRRESRCVASFGSRTSWRHTMLYRLRGFSKRCGYFSKILSSSCRRTKSYAASGA